MPSAGLLAKKAVGAGLRVRPYIQTSLAPGSGMVTHYLNTSGVLPYLSQLGCVDPSICPNAPHTHLHIGCLHGA